LTPLASNTPSAPSAPPAPSAPCQLVWLRRDLRLADHAALAEALRHPEPIVPVFVFDRDILNSLPAADRRVAFLHQTLGMLQSELMEAGGCLLVVHGWAQQAMPTLAKALGAVRVICAEDYEPQAIARDQAVAKAMAADGIDLVQVQDQCLFAKQQLLTGAGRPFSVFTPYKNAWLKAFTPEQANERSTTGLAQALANPKVIDSRLACMPASDAIERVGVTQLPSLDEMGFAGGTHDDASSLLGKAAPLQAGPTAAQALLQDFVGRMGQYKDARDFPAKKGPSYLSVHLRFGTISARECVRQAMGLIQTDPAQSVGAQTWLSELIWREFYFQILANFPHVVTNSFKPVYDRIEWLPEDAPRFEPRWQAWCLGQTGYPLVDAGMRQLNQTGYMHNRLRMVVASFLTKDLGIHWLRGERYFAQQLNDYDLSANNGGWQWAASTGCDAQPYFRIFNPVSQSEKFDPKGQFIRRYVPELADLSDKDIHAPWLAPAISLQSAGIRLGEHYPHPVVDHAQARAETLARFAVVKQSGD
jgi:deoxyribodipyrimidine photo-lyase